MGLFRKKPSHPPVTTQPAFPRTLSLPDLHDTPSGDLSVPSAWLDPSVPVPATIGPSSSLNGYLSQNGTPKSSFNAIRTGFHRPFRGGTGAGGASSVASPSVSSFVAPGSASGVGRGAGSVRSRRNKLQPTTFNLGVVGGTGTGKSSLLRLIIQTLDLSPTAPDDVRDKIGSFRTTSARDDWTMSVEVMSPVSRSDRVLLTVVDTPGLPFAPGRELELDRGVSVLMKELEGRLGETMREESKVIRTTKGDDHMHLLLYLIDPMAVLNSGSPPPSASGYVPATPALPLLPSPLLPHLSNGDAPAPSTLATSAPIESTMHLPPAQIKALKRLATRTNILPVLTKTDLLTSRQLAQVRAVVRRDLAGVDLGEKILSLADEDEEEEYASSDGPGSGRATPTKRADDGRLVHSIPKGVEQPRRGVIRLRSTRSSPKLRGLAKEAEGTAPPTPVTGVEELREKKKVVLPLALVAPEEVEESGSGKANGEEAGRRFVREYPWGTLSVLDPDHSDFVPFQQALFSSIDHLKQTTREVVFEKFRMEKLLIRRATQTLPDAERQRMMGRFN